MNKPSPILFDLTLKDYKHTVLIPHEYLLFSTLEYTDIDEYIESVKHEIMRRLDECSLAMKVKKEEKNVDV